MAKLRNLFPLLCALYAASAGAQGALDLYTISQTDLRVVPGLCLWQARLVR